ncbi:hypothetical protein [Prevotella sp.]|uniref:hypothetical protein n=1 Tax=Prevotella sp. TaxID=59823 RepID=UPI0027E222B8|nr:hypothetical protein [Prevotella sp.]
MFALHFKTVIIADVRNYMKKFMTYSVHNASFVIRCANCDNAFSFAYVRVGKSSLVTRQ